MSHKSYQRHNWSKCPPSSCARPCNSPSGLYSVCHHTDDSQVSCQSPFLDLLLQRPERIIWWKNETNVCIWSPRNLPRFFSLGSLESLELLRQNELAAAVNVVHDLLLEQSQLVPEDVGRGNQLRVLALQVFDPILQP